MKIFIEIPTWLGDAVMSTPAIENLISLNKDCDITIFGAYVSTKLFNNHPNVKSIIIDNSKKSKFRYIKLYKIAKSLGEFDIAISFRSSFSSTAFLQFINTKKRFQFKKTDIEKHQVLKYNDLTNNILNKELAARDLKLYYKSFNYENKTLGINPGATYGSAKRWYPEEFAKVAVSLSSKYDIVIFGGPGETDIANDIEKELIRNKVSNYKNLAGKTTIPELIEDIAGLDLFITNDSGPMHVAAAFKIPTISIFGPTKFTETNQWMNPNGVIVTKNLECAPCMKRACPLKHHDCMKLISSKDVLKEISKL